MPKPRTPRLAHGWVVGVGVLAMGACSFNDHGNAVGAGIDAAAPDAKVVDVDASAVTLIDAFVAPPPADAAPACASNSNYAPLDGFSNGSVYRFVTDSPSSLAWADAEADCEADGAHLFVLSSQDELDALINQPDPNNITGFSTWTGVTDFVASGNFLAVTSEGSPFFPWAHNQPDTTTMNYDCVRLRSGTLRTQLCDTTYKYVCECDGRPGVAANYTPPQ